MLLIHSTTRIINYTSGKEMWDNKYEIKNKHKKIVLYEILYKLFYK